jgi:hypothetical protein
MGSTSYTLILVHANVKTANQRQMVNAENHNENKIHFPKQHQKLDLHKHNDVTGLLS